MRRERTHRRRQESRNLGSGINLPLTGRPASGSGGGVAERQPSRLGRGPPGSGRSSGAPLIPERIGRGPDHFAWA
jgi:hypothetical protein